MKNKMFCYCFGSVYFTNLLMSRNIFKGSGWARPVLEIDSEKDIDYRLPIDSFNPGPD